MGGLQRGRAIVRRVSARDRDRSYRPGDFMLTRSSGGLARLLGLATGGPLNHAALIVDPSGGLIEATPDVALGGATVRRAHIADYLAADAPCWVGYVELQEGTRRAVVDMAEELLARRAPLGGLGLLALAVQTLVGIAPRARSARHAWLRSVGGLFAGQALVLREERTYLAGELVARALERGGFIWDRDPVYVTPAELYERFHLEDEEDARAAMPLSLERARSARRGGRRRADAGHAAGPAAATDALAPRVGPYAGRPPSGPMGATMAVGLATTPHPGEWVAPDVARSAAQVMLWALAGLSLVYGIDAMVRSLRPE